MFAVHEQVVLQLSSSALRDEVLLALRGLQQHDGTIVRDTGFEEKPVTTGMVRCWRSSQGCGWRSQ